MRHSLLLVMTAVSCLPGAAAAQGTAPSQADIVAELRQLRSELDEARAELRRLRADLDRIAPDAAAPRAGATPIPAEVEMLQAQVAELAQTKVASGSRLPVTIFGTIHSTVAGNSGEANWLDNPNLVAAPPPTPVGSLTATMRQTRVGIRADGLALGSWQGSGAVVLDFFGGIPGFQTGQTMWIPRLVYAFTRLERDGTALHVGQDEMMLAPRNPTSLAALAFPLLFRSGNLYLRLPQARIEHRLASAGDGEVRVAVGIVAPVGGDFRSTAYTFVPPALGGERSRRPGVQARLAWLRGDEERGTSLGVSGHYSRERPLEESITSHAAAIDFNWQGSRVGVGGELFVGENIDAFGGALGQMSRAAGGFVEARVRPLARWEAVVGVGTDRPRGAAPLTRNESAYGSLTFRATPEIATSVEYRWLETSAGPSRRRNNHVNWAVTYGF